MRKAKISLKYSFEGCMIQETGGKYPGSNNVEINIKIGPDARIIDLEKLFGEIQNKYILWTREFDIDRNYMVEE